MNYSSQLSTKGLTRWAVSEDKFDPAGRAARSNVTSKPPALKTFPKLLPGGEVT